VLEGGEVVYAGKSATNPAVTAQIEAALQGAVQSARLADQGIDPSRLASALRPIHFETRKTGSGTARGSGEALYFLGYLLGFVIYMAVLIFGMSVMRGVLDEKKDRIVEVIVSSVRAWDLMLGKVLGIGGAAMLQMAVWAGFAALALNYGDAIVSRFGGPHITLPHVPLSVGVLFLAYFAGGFLLYAGIYAAMGALAASDQDLQQLQFPAMLPLIISFFVMLRALAEPEGPIAVAASWIPFSSPLVMPIRSALTSLSPLEIGGSLAVLFGTMALFVWVGAKIYRVGILATGKRPTLRELAVWLRSA
jgi:ABC-2 type transport system permease protein